MHCERARATLLEHLNRPPADRDPELDAHLDGCADCTALAQDLEGLEAQARVWHELSPPPWNPAPGAWHREPWAATSMADGWRRWLQQWLPLTASVVALLLAVALYWRGGLGAVESAPALVADATEPPVETLLATSRQEREQELEALTVLLKAEMDRRSLETAESLKYIISHQIQSQRQLDALRGRLAESEPAADQL
jgi:hypothetical protein